MGATGKREEDDATSMPSRGISWLWDILGRQFLFFAPFLSYIEYCRQKFTVELHGFASPLSAFAKL